MNVAALIMAAGRGTRLGGERVGGDRRPKQYRDLGGRTVLAATVEQFARHADIATVTVVIHADDTALYRDALDVSQRKLTPPVTGGATRQASVRNGLEALAAFETVPDVVLIHDAARPFVTDDDITKVLAGVEETGAAIAACPLADTLKRQANSDEVVETTVDRGGLWRALTPQGFHFDAIRAAHLSAAERDDLTDDAAVAEAEGLKVRLIATSSDNFKITTADDLARARKRFSEDALGAQPPLPDVRVGQGFDVHKFGPGDHVWLAGLRIPHSHALVGHSDADVGLHALTDAIFGALGDGDIGSHFPPSDDQWKGAASDQFLAYAVARAHERQAQITQLDLTLVCEAPKIGPHRDAMRARIAEITGIDVSRIAVKATTSEGLGFPGRREGIAALASATLVFPGRIT
ncbi:MAG: bifunctional 2-C-methyl-D-erythritol 4-phosphate cytidylyltransferase/2-C-methyl-D-erythritol 2,4-cyclodiphosphate synthase [Pseudomonadota bacterium]